MSQKTASRQEPIGHPPGLAKMHGANAMRDMAAHKQMREARQKQCHNMFSSLSSLSEVSTSKDTSIRTRAKSEMLEFRMAQRAQKKDEQKAHNIRIKGTAVRDIGQEGKLIMEALHQDAMRQVFVQQTLIDQLLKQQGSMNEQLQRGMSEWIAGHEDDDQVEHNELIAEDSAEDAQEEHEEFTADAQAQTIAYVEPKMPLEEG